jgi:hypothetical protein
MNTKDLAFNIAQDLRVLPAYQEDPYARMIKSLENEMSVARYSAGAMMDSMMDGTDVDLTGLDCVHFKENEYWVEEEHFEMVDYQNGTITFEDIEGKEVEPKLVRPIP